jgi:membrane-associated phospholipid phosphatase
MISTPIPRAKTPEKFFGDLRSPDLLAKQPLIGVMIFLLSSLIFGLLAYYIHQNGSLVQWDITIGNRMHETALNSPAWIKGIMLAGFYIGLHGYFAIGILLGIYFLIKKFWKEYYMLALLFVGEAVFWFFVSKYFARMRPEYPEQIGSVVNYPSFPSGHSMSGVIGCAIIAYILLPKISSRFWKAMVIIIAVLMMLYIGFSRFFMGAHYFTDVVAGLAAGFAWTSLVVLLIELSYKKGVHQHVKEKETYTR